MFKCEVSDQVSLPGEKAFHIITKTRKKEYFEYRKKDEKSPSLLVKVGEGYEIVEEKLVCKEIYDNYNGLKYE